MQVRKDPNRNGGVWGARAPGQKSEDARHNPQTQQPRCKPRTWSTRNLGEVPRCVRNDDIPLEKRATVETRGIGAELDTVMKHNI